jgi:general secretion pathway protein G
MNAENTDRTSRSHAPRKSGFTLVELLVVLVILIVIGTIAAQNFGSEPDKAKVKATRVSFGSLETALERFKIDCGRYPTEEEGLDALMTAPEGLEADWGPASYLKKERDIRDAWGNGYAYQAPGPNGEAFAITSFGADGAEGGESFNADLSNNDE